MTSFSKFTGLSIKNSNNLTSHKSTPCSIEEYQSRLNQLLSKSKYVETIDYFISLNQLSSEKAHEIFDYIRTGFTIRSIKSTHENLNSYRRLLRLVVNSDLLVSSYSGAYLFKNYSPEASARLLSVEESLSDNAVVADGSLSISGLMKYMMLNYRKDKAIDDISESLNAVPDYHSIYQNYHVNPYPDVCDLSSMYSEYVPSYDSRTPFVFSVEQLVNTVVYKNTVSFVVSAIIDSKEFIAVLDTSASNPTIVYLKNQIANRTQIQVTATPRILDTISGTEFFSFSEGDWYLLDK